MARMIKVDVHKAPSLPHGESGEGIVVGIPLGYQPLCASRGYLIAEKLLSQARSTVGVPDDRYQDLPKHLYDLDSLMLLAEVVETLEDASNWLPMLIGEQGKQWKGDNMKEREIAQRISNDINDMSLDKWKLAEELMKDHNTLLQSKLDVFYKVIILASRRWKTSSWVDLRNEASFKLASDIVDCIGEERLKHMPFI